MQAAEQSQQRGERRGGQEAILHFQDAVHKYRQCMTENPDAETLANAQVLCSETIQLWAKAILAAEAHLPDSEQSIDVERSAQRQVRELYQEAVQVGAYRDNLLLPVVLPGLECPPYVHRQLHASLLSSAASYNYGGSGTAPHVRVPLW